MRFIIVNSKKNANLKTENYVLFGGFAEGLSLGGSLSDNSEGLLWIGKGGARIYRSFAKQTNKQKKHTKQVVGTSKDYC